MGDWVGLKYPFSNYSDEMIVSSFLKNRVVYDLLNEYRVTKSRIILHHNFSGQGGLLVSDPCYF